MRIAFLAPELNARYGWSRYALDIACALSTQGIEVVAFTQRGTSLPADLKSLADVRPILPTLVPPKRWFLARSLAAAAGLRRAAADCDLLHSTAEPYTFLAVLAAGKRPLVVTAHGTYVPHDIRRGTLGGLFRRIYSRAHLIAVSEYTATQVRAVLPGADMTIVRNGVDFARFQVPAPQPVKSGPTVLASGGVKMRKGTHLLVAAMARVREHIPDVQLVVTGRQADPDYLALVHHQIADLGLQNCVHLAGEIPERELIGWYQHADVFALPSLTVGGKFEGFGLVFLEASASGLPVIGTTGSGVEEALIDGETGLLVPQDNAPALAEAIIRLLSDDTLRVRLGTAGREYARTQDWSGVAAHIMALYRQLLT